VPPFVNAVIVWPVFGGSGVSSASALSAGDDSAPDTSEKSSWSKGFRGVVKDGLRNCGAGADDAAMKELEVWLDSNPSALNVSLSPLGILPWILKHTLLAMLWLELGKGRLGIGRALSLPFPVHGTFMRASGLNVVEHGENAVSIRRKEDVVARRRAASK
jgi:hypothetical protein